MRYPLVDGQGNFGSIDGDSAAAMRYTEARMTAMAEEMLSDIGKETVDTSPNFDGSLEEPDVLPAALPNLLMNGASGIAVGMATNVPPHNLGELVDGIVATIENPEITIDELIEHIPAPDFPTGGIIHGYSGVKEAYMTGRGRIPVRARMHEELIRDTRNALVVTEIPYQVNKTTLLEQIARQVREERIEGIADLRDESDREGMRIVIELKRDAQPLVVENKLYKYSYLQRTFGANVVALVNGRPRTLTLKEAIEHYIAHREEIVVRRTEYELEKARNRAHILEGLRIALDHLDEVIAIIRHSEDVEEARVNLQNGVIPAKLTTEQRERLQLPTGDESIFSLSEEQTEAILSMQLRRLTGLERQKIEDEYRDLLQKIERFKSILSSEEMRMRIITDELQEMKEKYDDERRTDIDYTGGGEFAMEDLIEDESMVVTITHQGLIKRTPVTAYRQQGRGGKGMKGVGRRAEDYVEHLFSTSAHDYLLFFTDHGQCFWLRVFEIPEGGRTARGRSLRNLIQIEQDDAIRTVLAISKDRFEDEEFTNSNYVLMATRQGMVKKSVLEAFSRPRVDGIIAISINDDDQLLEACLTNGDMDIVLGSSSGRAIRFHEDDVRPTGRDTQGVRGMVLDDSEELVGLIGITTDEEDILAMSRNGYGKRTAIDEYPVQSRNGKGVITQKTTERVGRMIALKSVVNSDDLMVITEAGLMIRFSVEDISVMGRNTQGIRLIRLNEDDVIADVTRLVPEEEDGESQEKPANGEEATDIGDPEMGAATNGEA
jgi:DNA gyrase subunit A